MVSARRWPDSDGRHGIGATCRPQRMLMWRSATIRTGRGGRGDPVCSAVRAASDHAAPGYRGDVRGGVPSLPVAGAAIDGQCGRRCGVHEPYRPEQPPWVPAHLHFVRHGGPRRVVTSSCPSRIRGGAMRWGQASCPPIGQALGRRQVVPPSELTCSGPRPGPPSYAGCRATTRRTVRDTAPASRPRDWQGLTRAGHDDAPDANVRGLPERLCACLRRSLRCAGTTWHGRSPAP